jgi:hypothetical protein
MNTKSNLSSSPRSSRRVLAWWDVNVDIGTFHKRKLTSRPLKELERALGHRLHVEGGLRYERMPSNVWKFEAYSYLDTSDPALAAWSMLTQLSQFSQRLDMSGFNKSASAQSDNTDDATICAFYWSPPDQSGMPRYVSSGVLLKLIDASIMYGFDRGVESRRLHARPVVQTPAAQTELADYLVEFTAHIICGNKQDLMNFHLPRFQAARWPLGLDHVEVDAHTHAGKPNIIRFRDRLLKLHEHEAVARCLAFAQGFRINLDRHEGFHLAGKRCPGPDYTDGIVSFAMTRI